MKYTFEEELVAIGILAVTKNLLERAGESLGVEESEKRIKECVDGLIVNHTKEVLLIIKSAKRS